MNRENKILDVASLDVNVKKKPRKKTRSTQALALSLESVRDFVDGKRSFFHISYDNIKIPYILPTDIMDLMCYCGKIFSKQIQLCGACALSQEGRELDALEHHPVHNRRIIM